MEFSYKEKGVLISLLVTLLVFGWYLLGAFSNLSVDTQVPKLSQIIGLIIGVVVFESILHSALALLTKQELEDERDRLIEKVSYRYSYWFLAACLWFLMIHILLESTFGISSALMTPGGLFHLLLLFFVLSELVHFLSQLYHYRLGV